MTKKGQIYIGTSGWHYTHWIGTFYPIDTAEADQLAVYQSSFTTVELNNSFYRLPTAKAFRDWKAQTPDGFTFAVKASRFITHMKKLNVGKADIDKFLHRAGHLENKLGPILFQLPPNWNVNTERLGHFLSLLPQGHRYVFEFRNASWESDKVYQLLEEYGCAYCIYELGGYTSPEKVTGGFAYVRLHGPGAKYQGSYPPADLRKWAARCRQWRAGGKDVYFYFDNDQNGYAARNACALKDMLGRRNQ